MAAVHMAAAGMVIEIEMATVEAGFATNDIEMGASSPTLGTPLNGTNTPTLVFSTQGSSNDASDTSVFKLSQLVIEGADPAMQSVVRAVFALQEEKIQLLEERLREVKEKREGFTLLVETLRRENKELKAERDALRSQAAQTGQREI